MNFRYKLMQFMSGRYGADSLFYLLFAVSSVLSIINCFLHSKILQFIVYAIIIYAIFRIMSRNIQARSRENQVFNNIKNKWLNKLKSLFTNLSFIALYWFSL